MGLICRARRGFQERQTECVGVIGEAADGCFADAARRLVDDPQQRDGVLRVVQEVQIGQDIFDFFALEELDAVDHLVGNGELAKGELERPAQGVDSVEDGEIAGPPPAALNVGLDLRGDSIGLVLLRRIGYEPDGRSLAVLGE